MARTKKTAEAPADGQVTVLAPAEAPNDAVLLTMTAESGYTQPKTLRQLEVIIETNGKAGAEKWRKVADALLAIKTHRLWKKAKDENGDPYPSFVVYAEARFGFKKTYAYDLVKAATRKPAALTERAARAEMAAEGAAKKLDVATVADRMAAAWVKLEDRLGDLRDRSDDDSFIELYDETMATLGGVWRGFIGEAQALAAAKSAPVVNPLQEDEEVSATAE